jgi:hypothetical protein
MRRETDGLGAQDAALMTRKLEDEKEMYLNDVQAYLTRLLSRPHVFKDARHLQVHIFRELCSCLCLSVKTNQLFVLRLACRCKCVRSLLQTVTTLHVNCCQTGFRCGRGP